MDTNIPAKKKAGEKEREAKKATEINRVRERERERVSEEKKGKERTGKQTKLVLVIWHAL
jgi:hypothetical protein